MVNWDSPTWGGHVHTDPAGSWVNDSHTETAEDY
jgi:hypothetical protein